MKHIVLWHLNSSISSGFIKLCFTLVVRSRLRLPAYCVVSLSKTLCPLFSTGSTLEDQKLAQHDGKTVASILNKQILNACDGPSSYLCQVLIVHSFCLKTKGNFGYCPCAPFLRQEMGKVVWVPSFDHLQIRINTEFRYPYVRWIFPHFLDKIK